MVDGKWTTYRSFFIDQKPYPCELDIYKQREESPCYDKTVPLHSKTLLIIFLGKSYGFEQMVPHICVLLDKNYFARVGLV